MRKGTLCVLSKNFKPKPQFQGKITKLLRLLICLFAENVRALRVTNIDFNNETCPCDGENKLNISQWLRRNHLQNKWLCFQTVFYFLLPMSVSESLTR